MTTLNSDILSQIEREEPKEIVFKILEDGFIQVNIINETKNLPILFFKDDGKLDEFISSFCREVLEHLGAKFNYEIAFRNFELISLKPKPLSSSEKRRLRVSHILKINKKGEFPQRLLFYDTETEPNEKIGDLTIHKLKLVTAIYVRLEKNFSYHSRIVRSFENAQDFWNFVLSKVYDSTTLYIFSHNEHFDFNAVEGFKYLAQNGYELKKFVIDSNRFILHWKNGRKKIVVLDTFNYVHSSVEEIGHSIGLEKLSINFETASKEELLKYNIRDVEIIEKFVINLLKFVHNNNLGNFGVTTPHLAFNSFRHRFMKTKIYITSNQDVEKLEMDSYHGGRTEAFFVGEVKESPIYVLDVNSLYPSVMKGNKYPVRLVTHGYKLSREALKKLLEKYLVIAKVHIKTDKPLYPKKNGKLIFPIGKFWTTLATPELKIALERGDILGIKDYAVYESAEIFTFYVDFFYSLRKQAKEKRDKVMDLMSKLFLNSLYGKFGQRTSRYSVEGELPNKEGVEFGKMIDEQGNVNSYIVINGKMFKVEKEDLSFDSFPAISSHVTSYARVKLLEYIQIAGWENVYYVDTDSLFVNQKGLENLKAFIDNKELGKLKLEKQFEHLTIRGAKDYKSEKDEKIKGVPYKALRLQDNKFEYTQFLKTKTLIHKQLLNQIATREIVKELQRKYDKGLIAKDGRVLPLEFKEDE